MSLFKVLKMIRYMLLALVCSKVVDCLALVIQMCFLSYQLVKLVNMNVKEIL